MSAKSGESCDDNGSSIRGFRQPSAMKPCATSTVAVYNSMPERVFESLLLSLDRLCRSDHMAESEDSIRLVHR